MNRTAKCIKMLRILNTGRVYKVKELADLLETKERNVIDYKDELNALGVEEGFIIVGIPGKYGGYQLNHTYPLTSFRFTDGERKALTEGLGYLEAHNDFPFRQDFRSAMSKVLSSFEHEEKEANPLFSFGVPLSASNEELEKRYRAVERCIEKNCELEIEYESLEHAKSTATVQPYKLYSYNDAWYFLAYHPKEDKFKYYKLNRVQNYTETNVKFRRKLFYTEADYLDSFGMKENGDWYPIKLQISGAYATLVKERTYGKDQTIETMPDGSVILTCRMQNIHRVEAFILSLGTNCHILEPDSLKQHIGEILEEIGKLYK